MVGGVKITVPLRFGGANVGTCNIGVLHIQEKILFEQFAGGFKAAHVLPKIISDVPANSELNWPSHVAA